MTTWTNRGATRVMAGTFDPTALELALLTAAPAPAVARLWNTEADIVGELTTTEVANYLRKPLLSPTTTEWDDYHEARLDFADTAFGSLVVPAVTPSLQVVAVAAIDTVTNDVMWVADLVTRQTPNGQPFTVVWPANGAAAARHPA
jgi:hypothetical protein